MITNRNIYLQSNYVDKTLQAALLPINILQYTSFISKYTIRNNIIYPKRHVYDILSFVFVCVVIYSHYCHSKIDGIYDKPFLFHSTIDYSLFFNFIFYCFDGLLLFISNIYSSKYAVQLVINVQKITTSFRIFHNNFKGLKRENWIYVGGIYCIYLVIGLVYIIFFHFELQVTASRFGYVFILLYYDVSIICTFRYVKLCDECLGLWIANVRLYTKQFRGYNSEFEKNNEDYYLRGLLNAYSNILNSFDLTKKIFQLPILLQIVDCFAHGLIYTQLFIEMGKMAILNNASSIGIFTQGFVFCWMVKNIIVLSLCIKGCEDFYITITEAERNCVVYLGNYKCYELKKLYKNVIRINRAKFSKMTACGFLTMDANLPLRLFEQWAVYVVVLLQFAFH